MKDKVEQQAERERKGKVNLAGADEIPQEEDARQKQQARPGKDKDVSQPVIGAVGIELGREFEEIEIWQPNN